MKLILFAAKTAGDEKNCLYPDRLEIGDADALKKAVRLDHVCAEYKDSYRNNDNFIRSECIVMDCDNDASDDPATWVTPESLSEEFADVAYV